MIVIDSLFKNAVNTSTAYNTSCISLRYSPVLETKHTNGVTPCSLHLQRRRAGQVSNQQARYLRSLIVYPEEGGSTFLRKATGITSQTTPYLCSENHYSTKTDMGEAHATHPTERSWLVERAHGV
jgi:hypothetical protein